MVQTVFAIHICKWPQIWVRKINEIFVNFQWKNLVFKLQWSLHSISGETDLQLQDKLDICEIWFSLGDSKNGSALILLNSKLTYATFDASIVFHSNWIHIWTLSSFSNGIFSRYLTRAICKIMNSSKLGPGLFRTSSVLEYFCLVSVLLYLIQTKVKCQVFWVKATFGIDHFCVASEDRSVLCIPGCGGFNSHHVLIIVSVSML